MSRRWRYVRERARVRWSSAVRASGHRSATRPVVWQPSTRLLTVPRDLSACAASLCQGVYVRRATLRFLHCTQVSSVDAPCQQGLIDQSKTKPKPGMPKVRVLTEVEWPS